MSAATAPPRLSYEKPPVTPSIEKDGSSSDVESARGPPSETNPAGVNRIESLYEVFGTGWKLRGFWAALLLWIIAFNMSGATSYVYLPFATSAFEMHTIIGTIGVVTLIMGGVLPPFWAKTADLLSRPWALLGALVFYTLGYAVTAGSNTVSAVSAGQVVYTMGTSGMNFVQTLLIADITSLQWRGFVQGAVSLFYIPFALAAPQITGAISLANWRWGFGMFCIIMPVCIVPILFVLFWADRKARKSGLLSVAASSTAYQMGLTGDNGEVTNKSTWGRICYACSSIDAFGLILLGFAFALLLAPPTLTTTAANGWKNPSMIAMEVVGGVLFIVFCIWEFFFARNPIQPRRIWNKTFTMCIIIDFTYYLVGYFTDVYWSSWLYVVKDYSDTDYSYMLQITTICLCFFAVVGGAIQRYTHRYKWLQVSGLAVRCIGSGLNYWVSCGNISTGAIVMSRFLLMAGGGVSVISSQVASQGSVKHKDMGIAIAILTLWTQIGGAIGSAISAAMWNSELPKQLAIHVGEFLTADEITAVYGDITVARVAEPRAEIIKAYNAAYRKLSLPALGCIFIPLIAAFFTTNYHLGDRHNAVEETIIKPLSQEQVAANLARAKAQTEAAAVEEKRQDEQRH